MVGHSENLLRAQDADAFVAKRVERLRRRNLVEIQTVDIELGGTIGHVLHDMSIPNLVKKSLHELLLFCMIL